MQATYEIRTVADASALTAAPQTELTHFYSVGNGYEPQTTAAVIWVPGEGLYARMRCWETDPKADEKTEDGDVYKDSCMEFFLNCAPENGEDYLNLEGNAAGTLHCKYGRDRYERKALSEIGVNLRPTAKSRILPDHWEIDYFIPIKLIHAVFGKSTLVHGDRLKGNFYKCGDEAPLPHFGMWSLVCTEQLDFHLPAFFGDLVIE